MRLPPHAAVAFLCVLGGLTACSVVNGDSADEAAERLAAGLSTHSLDRVQLTSDPDRERYAEVVRNVRDLPVRVSSTKVDEDGSTATVTLAWTWTLREEEWAYETTVDLVDSAGTWEVDWAPESMAPGLSADEALDVDLLTGERGDILGARDQPLVTERPVVRYGLDKAATKPRRWDASAARIARAVGVDVASYRRKVNAYGETAFVEAIVLRTEEALELINAEYGEIPGAAVVDDEIPLAPTREFAAPLLGTVGVATAEIIEEADGTIQEGDEVGLSGLQSRYDEQLRGTSGVRVQAVDSTGDERTLVREEARDGKDLRTTLDQDLQLKAESILAEFTAADGPHSALVAIRPSTGEVLAAANGPANNGFNAATAGQYAPGSTFKVVTALALLRSGVTPDDVLECGATTVVDGRSFKNYDDYPSAGLGSITLTQTIANSCNTGLINTRGALNEDTLTAAAAALGMGVDHDLGFPAYFGQVPPATGATDQAASLIGQGRVLASPLTMATVAASTATGDAVLPVLLPDHQVNQQEPPTPLTATEAGQLRDMMRAVVTEGSAAFLAALPEDVGAKTGTAEYGIPDAAGALPTHTWMIATQGDLAVAVFVETGQSGSVTAGPILGAFLK